MNILCVMIPGMRFFGAAQLVQTGITYVSAALKAAGHTVTCLNLNYEIANDMSAVIGEAMDKNAIQCVMAGGYVTQWHEVADVISTAKHYNPQVFTVIGGGLVTFSPVEAMKLIPQADYGVIGEGEYTSQHLIHALEHNHSASSVKGIIYRDGEKLHITEDAPPIDDLDSLPMPDYEGFGIFELFSKWGGAGIVTSRGCPFRCTYCTRSGGKKYRVRSLDKVFGELDFMLQRAKITKITFTDELFSVNRERLIAFCERIKPYNLNWFISMRVDSNLTVSDLRMMKDAGCEYFQIGIESYDDSILKSMDKKITRDQVETFLVNCKRAGIRAGGGVIIGDPAETFETLQNSVQYATAHADILSNFSLSPIVLYPGSRIYDDAVRLGKIDALEHIRKGCPLVNVSAMTDEEYRYCITEYAPKMQRAVNDLIARTRYRYKVKFIGLDKKFCVVKVQITCGFCGEQFESFVDFDMITTVFSTEECPHCHTRPASPFPLLDFETIKPDLERSLSEIFHRSSGDVVVWGLGEVYDVIWDFLLQCEEKYGQGKHFILADKSKCGSVVNGRPVFDPDAVMPDTEYCLITAFMVFSSINQMAFRINPDCVTLSIIDLICFDSPIFTFVRDRRIRGFNGYFDNAK